MEGGHCGCGPRFLSHSLEGQQGLPLERGAQASKRNQCSCGRIRRLSGDLRENDYSRGRS